MMDNLYDCTECKFDHICCYSDGWAINLTPTESKVFPHVKAPDGQYLMASNPHGYCFYFDEEYKQCRCYTERPSVCRKFVCTECEQRMKELMQKKEANHDELVSKCAGFLVAFIHDASKQKISGQLQITDVESLKKVYLTPSQIFGDSDQEVKEKMIDILRLPFKGEDI